jgi:alkaline phosphatase D
VIKVFNIILVVLLFLCLNYVTLFAADRYTLSVACGDVQADEATIWVRGTFAASVTIEYANNNLFNNSKEANDLTITDFDDYTGKITLKDLPLGQKIFYRAYFKNLKSPYNIEGPIMGVCKTPGTSLEPVKFLWSSGIGTDGFGINGPWGGMKIFKTMSNRQADFSILAGNIISADVPLESSKKIDGKRVWYNVVTADKQRVAESISDFWGHYRYNLLDEAFRKFIANNAIYAIWNDHEFYNNWYPDEVINDARYKEKSINVLVANGKKAFFDYMPIKINSYAPNRIYKNIKYGPFLELFLLDMRSYRGASNENTQEQKNAFTSLLGDAQLSWLKNSLLESKALWKIIVLPQPISFIIEDGKAAFDGIANMDGPPRGREIEFSEILTYIKRNNVKNIIFLSGGLNFAAALSYDPSLARGSDFNPFYEFIAGPLNGATDVLKKVDNTFGPKILFSKSADNNSNKLSPLDGFQFFGEVNIERNGKLTVTFRDIIGNAIYSKSLEAQ